MLPRVVVFSNYVFRLLLQAYPPGFRDRFADEMGQVFHSHCCQVYQEQGSAGTASLLLHSVRDAAWGVLVQWWQKATRGRFVAMKTSVLNLTDGTVPLTIWEAALAALPFLLFGYASLASRVDALQLDRAWLPIWLRVWLSPSQVFNGLVLIGLAAGLIRCFPRWAYSYLGWAILMAWWWSDMRYQGYELGMKIWLPFFIVVVASLLIRRSLEPLRLILRGLWRDLTLISLGIYILYTYVFILADENHNPYLNVFIILSALAAALGAWGFFSTTSPLRRVLALMGGLFLAILVGLLNSATWDYRAYYNLPEGASEINLLGVIFIIVLCGLSVGLGLLTQRRVKRSG